MKGINIIIICLATFSAYGQSLTDTLRVDIDGRGNLEQIFFEGDDCRRLIISGGDLDTNLELGCGSKIAHIGEFSWVDNWKIVKKQLTYEVTFLDNGDIDGTRNVEMQNDGIYIGITEPTGGGIITFLNGKLTWIHQAD